MLTNYQCYENGRESPENSSIGEAASPKKAAIKYAKLCDSANKECESYCREIMVRFMANEELYHKYAVSIEIVYIYKAKAED